MPTTYPGVTPTHGIPTVTQDMVLRGPGASLSDHPARSATTIDGWKSLLFGLPFFLAGAFIIASAFHIIPVKGKHAPEWLVGLFGGFFLLPGMFLIGHGVVGIVRKIRYQREAARHPGQPWYGDYHWHTEGFRFSAFQAVLGRLSFALFWSAFLVPFFWIGAKGAWPFLVFSTIFALIGLYIWYRFLQKLADFVRHGNSFLEYDQFPYFLGSNCNVRLRTPPHIADLDQLTLTFRCVTEKYITTGVGNNRTSQVACYELYKDQATFSRERLAAMSGSSIPAQFSIPADQPATSLISTPPTYWEIEARGTSPQVNYVAYFLVPIYKTQ
jgi:hypothetical protein